MAATSVVPTSSPATWSYCLYSCGYAMVFARPQPLDELLKRRSRNAATGADPHGLDSALGQQLVELAPADAENVGRFSGPQQQLVHFSPSLSASPARRANSAVHR